MTWSTLFCDHHHDSTDGHSLVCWVSSLLTFIHLLYNLNQNKITFWLPYIYETNHLKYSVCFVSASVTWYCSTYVPLMPHAKLDISQTSSATVCETTITTYKFFVLPEKLRTNFLYSHRRSSITLDVSVFYYLIQNNWW